MYERAGRAHARPLAGFDGVKIGGKILDNRHAFGFGPFEIWITQKIRGQHLRTVGKRRLFLLVHFCISSWRVRRFSTPSVVMVASKKLDRSGELCEARKKRSLCQKPASPGSPAFSET